MAKHESRFTLGEAVNEKLTGFSGVVTVISHFISGCTHCCVESKKLNEKGDSISAWFDERRLVANPKGQKLELGPIDGPDDKPARRVGGPGPHPNMGPH